MVEQLPPTGALARAINGHEWRHADYMAADTSDLLGLLFTAFVNANRDPKKPPMKYPEPRWRPGDSLPEEAEAAAERNRVRARAAYEHITAQVLPGEG